MCGHTGMAFHDPRIEVDAELLRAMGRTIAHRGPDDDQVFVRGNVGGCFRRLSIIDLEGGAQPIPNGNEKIWAFANGEIYNFRQLRSDLEAKGYRFRTDSDCETIPHLYEEYGEAFVERLVGMFAFALVDLRGERPKLVLGRDRLGIKPMHYAETERGLVWGSEVKAVLASGEVGRRMRAPALLDYLVQGYLGGEDTAWEGVRRLPPAHTLTWEAGGAVTLRRYWELPREPVPAATEEEVLEFVDRVVRDRLVADVPLGAFLSGGIDSSAVVHSMAQQLDDPVIACSVGFEERSHNELDIARATARTLGARHHTKILQPDPRLAVETLPWFYDEPLADPSTVPTYLVSKMAREHVTVALSGDGGDETFAGYRRYTHDLAENKLRSAIGSVGRAFCRTAGAVYPKLDWAPRVFRGKTFLTNVGDDPARAYYRSVTQLTRSQAAELLAPELRAALSEHDPFEGFERFYRRPLGDDPLYRAQFADFHTYLPDQILAKVDRASMAVSLEVRVPLLDHRFVERFASIPAAQKISGGRGKHLLREALRPRLSATVLDGQKRGFDTPLRDWLRGPLAETVRAAVAGLPDTWFDRSVLEQRLAEHAAGKSDHGRLLWSLLVLEQWRVRHEVRDLVA